MSKILKQFSKLLIPFVCRADAPQQLTALLDANGKHVWEEKNFATNHLFDYIIAKQGNSQQAILRSLYLANGSRAQFGLPNANTSVNLSVRANQSGRPLAIKLREVALHLFETQIGFLEFEWEYRSDDADDYINANYFLAELKSQANVLQIPTGKDTYREITVAQAAEAVLSNLPQAFGFDRNKQLSFYDLKPILYSAVVLDGTDDECDKLVRLASHNFKQSYQTAAQKPFEPFENSRWCGTDMAMINVSNLVDDTKTNDFFVNQFPVAAKNNYFYLFLLTLNRKFSMLRRIAEMSEVNPKVYQSETELKRDDSYLSDLLVKAKLYRTRCCFNCPSSMDHLNAYFRYTEETQNLQSFEKEFEEKTKAIGDVLSTHKEKLRVYRDYRQTKMLFWVFVITQLIGSVTMFNSCCKIVEDLFDVTVWQEPKFLPIPIVLTLLFIVAIGFQIVIKFREMKKQKQLINDKTN